MTGFLIVPLLLIGLALAPMAAVAGVSGAACIEEDPGTGSITCTANDVRIGSLEVVGDPVTCDPTPVQCLGGTNAGEACTVDADCPDPFLGACLPELVTVELKATIESGPERYDVALWLNETGGSARTDPDGTCFREILTPIGEFPTETTNDCDSVSGPYANGDADSCGDIPKTELECANTVVVGSDLITERTFVASIPCVDTNDNGTADAGTCTSWSQRADDIVCGEVLDAIPGAPSKCECNPVEIFGLFTGCQTDEECNDGVACTDDVCTIVGNVGTCSSTPNHDVCLGDQCNDGVCDPVNDCQVVPKADSTPCEDGDFCTSESAAPGTPDHCESGTCVGIPVNCGPGDQCNDDVCNEDTNTCDVVPKADSTPCEDGDFCTSESAAPGTPDHCESGTCVGIPVNCGPGDQCNDDVCNEDTNTCDVVPKADSTPCEDGDFCTSESAAPGTPDHCESGTCVGIPVNCGPGDQCNDDVCNEDTNTCDVVPKADSTPCEDGDFCTSESAAPGTPDHCESGTCVGIPVNCGPGDQCNDDVCNEDTNTCDVVPKADSTPCEDGDFCTSESAAPGTPDHCESGTCVGIPVNCGPGDQCNDDVCNEDTNTCDVVPKADSTPCEDGDFCTSESAAPGTPDHCESGTCVGIPVNCGPGDQCNDDVCNEDTNTCDVVPKADSTPCEDGDFCTSESAAPGTPDHCESGTCVGIPVNCGPGDQCNDDVCNEDTNTCDVVPKADSTPCEDGDFCTSESAAPGTPDHCESGTCVGIPVNCGPGDQCNDDVCNEDTNTCDVVPKADSTPCEDGDFCTSESAAPGTPDHCESGTCVGIPVNCGPGDQCNDDVCNEDTNTCDVVPKADSTPCEDGDFCTSESAAPGTPDHCESGTCVGIPVNCGPGDQCNDDVCNEDTNTCDVVPKADSTPCEDGDFCTSESAAPGTPDHCESGTCVGIPVNCGPGDQCNDDVCNEDTNTCDVVPKADSTPCEDGDFCTSESAAPGTPDHCESGTCVGIPVNCGPGDQCNDDVCNEDTNTCDVVPKADSTPCEDGDFCTSESAAPGTPDHCESGTCVGIPVNCGPGDQCNDDVCNEDTNTCDVVPKADSTPCEDGDFCTSESAAPGTPDHCESGTCVGIPVNCGPGDQCNDDVCNEDTNTCDVVPKADSTPCEDGDFCTSESAAPGTPDHCESGTCVGIPVNCGPGDQCNDDVCNEDTNTCDVVPKADSTPCEDGDICTSETGIPQTSDHCSGGVCDGVEVGCDDGGTCNGDETCDTETGACLPGEFVCEEICQGKKPKPPKSIEWQYVNTLGDAAFDSVCITVVHPHDGLEEIQPSMVDDEGYFTTTRSGRKNRKLNPSLTFTICSQVEGVCTEICDEPFTVHTSCSIPLDIGLPFPDIGTHDIVVEGQFQ